MPKRNSKIFLSSLVFIILLAINPGILKAQDEDCADTDNRKVKNLYEKAFKEYRRASFGPTTQMLKEALEIEPDYVPALFIMGELSRKRKNYNMAENYYEKVVSLCPNYDRYAQYYLGQIRFAQKKYDEAVALLEFFISDVDKVKNDRDYFDAEAHIKYAKAYRAILDNPVAFEPKPVPGISSTGDEYLPIISPDNTMALFTRRFAEPLGKGSPIGARQNFVEKFMFSTRQNGAFTSGEPMPYPFNHFENEGGATLTIDNKFLYYSVERQDYTGRPNTDIFMSEYDYLNNQWGPIRALSNKVNCPVSWDAQPTISGDGNTIYFTSNRPGGYGGLDIYKTEKNENGEWGAAVNLGPTINTPGNEKSPFIHTDSQTLYFASGDSDDGLTTHIGLGGYDIFYSRMIDSVWTKPANIGYPINSEEDEHGFFVSTDGKTGYFASNKPDFGGPGGYDVFMFSLYQEARPEKVLLVSGTLKDEKTSEPITDAKVQLTNVTTKRVTEIPVDSVSGKYALAVLFNDDYRLTIEKEEYAYNAVYISQEDSTFEQPKKVDMEVQKIEVGETYKLNDIYFPTNSSVLTEGSKFVIEGFVDFLFKNKNVSVAIHGHTDSVGNADANLKLSDERAKSVYDYLIDKGIEARRLSYKGFGQTKPVAGNDTSVGRAQNRRTEFVVLQK